MNTCCFSPCRQYRYTLWRSWADELFPNCSNEGYVMFIGLNPSTADSLTDDPTIRRCIGFAQRWGYLTLCMTNLFAFRSTDPRKMLAAQDPIGAENDDLLNTCAAKAHRIVAAWGVNGNHRDRAGGVIRGLKARHFNLHCLRKTKAGHPAHPLYVPYATSLIAFP